MNNKELISELKTIIKPYVLIRRLENISDSTDFVKI
jgi:hypothetical protein